MITQPLDSGDVRHLRSSLWNHARYCRFRVAIGLSMKIEIYPHIGSDGSFRCVISLDPWCRKLPLPVNGQNTNEPPWVQGFEMSAHEAMDDAIMKIGRAVLKSRIEEP